MTNPQDEQLLPCPLPDKIYLSQYDEDEWRWSEDDGPCSDDYDDVVEYTRVPMPAEGRVEIVRLVNEYRKSLHLQKTQVTVKMLNDDGVTYRDHHDEEIAACEATLAALKASSPEPQGRNNLAIELQTKLLSIFDKRTRGAVSPWSFGFMTAVDEMLKILVPTSDSPQEAPMPAEGRVEREYAEDFRKARNNALAAAYEVCKGFETAEQCRQAIQELYENMNSHLPQPSKGN